MMVAAANLSKLWDFDTAPHNNQNSTNPGRGGPGFGLGLLIDIIGAAFRIGMEKEWEFVA